MRPIRLCFVSALVAIVGIGVFSGDRSDRPEIILPGNSTETMRFALPERADMLEARFALCGDRIRVNCVIDGDTFWFNGKKIRIADIDAPEIASPHCRDEKHMGEMARDHLLVLLNAGGLRWSRDGAMQTAMAANSVRSRVTDIPSVKRSSKTALPDAGMDRSATGVGPTENIHQRYHGRGIGVRGKGGGNRPLSPWEGV